MEKPFWKKTRPAFHLWTVQLHAFLKREITYSSDRLVAFAAISAGLAAAGGNRFIGGIWDGDRLHESLCWRALKPASAVPDMPSWTWCSSPGHVSFDLIDRGASRIAEFVPGFTVKSIDVQVNGLMTKVSGIITIRGKLFKQKSIDAASLVLTADAFQRKELPLGYSLGKVIYMDNELGQLQDCYMLTVLTIPRNENTTLPMVQHPAVLKLLLQPVLGRNNVFKRVGIGIQYADNPLDKKRKADNSVPRYSHMWLKWLEEGEYMGEKDIILV